MKQDSLNDSGKSRELFLSDVFQFSSQKRLRRMIVNICWACLVGSVGMAIVAYFMAWIQSLDVLLVTILGLGLILLVALAGRTRIAAVALILWIYFATATGVYLAGGIHDVGIIIFPLIIVIGSLTLKLPFFILLIALVVDFFVMAGLKEMASGEPFIYPTKDLGGDIVLLAVIIIIEATIMRLLAGVISGSMLRAYRSEKDYKEIFNATQSAIVIHDAETGRILDVNRATLDMYGYSQDEIVGMRVEDISGGDLNRAAEVSFENIKKARDEGAQLFEWLARKKDGTEFWTEVMLKLTEIGGTGRVLAMVHDIDERKRMEDHLRQGQKMEAVGLLAGGIAHDFNNQLTGIIGYTELSLSRLGDEDEQLRSNLNGVLLAADRSAELIAQLLAFARKAKYQSAPVDLHELVNEVSSLLCRSIDKNIEIECDLKADPSIVLGDSAQLQNAILNLAINARDAMPDGGMILLVTEVITITTPDLAFMSQEVVPGKYLQLTVTDTGVGMTKDVKERIFEPFFTTKMSGKGTGMGLPAVYGTMKNHGGSIAVYSEKGHGSSFVINLPIHESDGSEIVPEEDVVTNLKDKRVLIVDDDDVVCLVVERMVEQCGGTSEICRDGVEAVEYYKQYHNVIDAVVLDMVMPRMGGAETFYALQKINPDVKVIITSGFSINKNVQGLLDTGAEGFVQKPFRKGFLCAAISAACK